MILPKIIQGGMGAGVSSYALARAVSERGYLGVVSGTALDTILVRRLQNGDLNGQIKYALDNFPNKSIADRIYQKYYMPDKKRGDPYQLIPKWTLQPSVELLELSVVANFVEVYLAKHDHKGLVGINYLEKIQMPLLSSIYGAMLADVDCILIGAGIPWEIAGVLDKYIQHQVASLKITLRDDSNFVMSFDPRQVVGDIGVDLKRPVFLAIISAAVLAKKLKNKVDGFVVEWPEAGGHNMSPRGSRRLNERGEPIYGPKDEINLSLIQELQMPFWLAGGLGYPDWLKISLQIGANGIQVGTPFALCRESGVHTGYKQIMLQRIMNDTLVIFTDPCASPTGFPFKVVLLNGTISEDLVYQQRFRVCDLGYLRMPEIKTEGNIQYLCPAENIKVFVNKGGKKEEVVARKCLCNALMADIDLGQTQRKSGHELPLFTLGSDVNMVRQLVRYYGLNYSAADVLDFLLDQTG